MDALRSILSASPPVTCYELRLLQVLACLRPYSTRAPLSISSFHIRRKNLPAGILDPEDHKPSPWDYAHWEIFALKKKKTDSESQTLVTPTTRLKAHDPRTRRGNTSDRRLVQHVTRFPYDSGEVRPENLRYALHRSLTLRPRELQYMAPGQNESLLSLCPLPLDGIPVHVNPRVPHPSFRFSPPMAWSISESYRETRISRGRGSGSKLRHVG